MASPLLATKLHVPRRQRDLVARPRLSERLSRGAESALTLVSAPAGFGKTTLLAQWLAAVPAARRSVAWLSLDQRDNDPRLFWTYLVGALKTAGQGGGASPLSLLHPPQPPTEAGLATLLNDLDAIPADSGRARQGPGRCLLRPDPPPVLHSGSRSLGRGGRPGMPGERHRWSGATCPGRR